MRTPVTAALAAALSVTLPAYAASDADLAEIGAQLKQMKRDLRTLPEGSPMRSRTLLALAAALIIVSPFAYAEKAHVHGVAELNVSVEGATLRLALESPLDNLLGFERAPKGDQELNNVRRVASQLRQADKLFVPTPGAGCKLASVKVESAVIDPVLLGEAPVARTAAKAAQRDDQAGTGHEHADLDGEFIFHCAQPAALQGLEVRLFAAFPGYRQIRAQVVTAKRQSAAKLSPKASTLSWQP